MADFDKSTFLSSPDSAPGVPAQRRAQLPPTNAIPLFTDPSLIGALTDWRQVAAGEKRQVGLAGRVVAQITQQLGFPPGAIVFLNLEKNSALHADRSGSRFVTGRIAVPIQNRPPRGSELMATEFFIDEKRGAQVRLGDVVIDPSRDKNLATQIVTLLRNDPTISIHSVAKDRDGSFYIISLDESRGARPSEARVFRAQAGMVGEWPVDNVKITRGGAGSKASEIAITPKFGAPPLRLTLDEKSGKYQIFSGANSLENLSARAVLSPLK